MDDMARRAANVFVFVNVLAGVKVVIERRTRGAKALAKCLQWLTATSRTMNVDLEIGINFFDKSVVSCL
jgi:hypothetical protein